MPFANRRLAREYRTIEVMIGIFCRDHHETSPSLCTSCEELRAYAEYRLVKCPFGEEKPTCVNCTVHCYQTAMRERVREVMRYAGPRMLLRHPYLAVMHLVDGKIQAQELKKRRRETPSAAATR